MRGARQAASGSGHLSPTRGPTLTDSGHSRGADTFKVDRQRIDRKPNFPCLRSSARAAAEGAARLSDRHREGVVPVRPSYRARVRWQSNSKVVFAKVVQAKLAHAPVIQVKAAR